jgi:hypothetical protein
MISPQALTLETIGATESITEVDCHGTETDTTESTFVAGAHSMQSAPQSDGSRGFEGP